MKKFLSSFWRGWKKLGLIIGDFVSGVLLTFFYFTVFAVVAIPYRILTKKPKNKITNFIIKQKTISTLEDFKNE